MLGYAQKSPCADGNWTGSKQYTHMCYSDVVPLWGAERLSVGGVPYRDTAVEYPVLTGGFMWLSAELTNGLRSLEDEWSDVVVFGGVTVFLLAICAADGHRGDRADRAAAARTTRRCSRCRRCWCSTRSRTGTCSRWRCSPARCGRGRARNPVAAGVLIGLGTAAKLYPVFFLVALAILAIRTRRAAGFVWCTVAAAAAWAAVNVPSRSRTRTAGRSFYTFSMERETERSTVWAIVKTLVTSRRRRRRTRRSGSRPARRSRWRWAASLLLVLWLGLNAPTKPRLAQLTFLVVLAFLLTTKVWSPQYSLWLVPLLALARPRWRLALVWQFVEIAVWFATLTLLLGLSTPAHGLGYGWLILILLVRDGLLLALARAGHARHVAPGAATSSARTGRTTPAAANSTARRTTSSGSPADGSCGGRARPAPARTRSVAP